ncbi:MAG: hypothetical protein KDD40_00785 [Bdellovibrionales bacterium]|nr:hypothetical protein [Bdellovibrionales bacterium]
MNKIFYLLFISVFCTQIFVNPSVLADDSSDPSQECDEVLSSPEVEADFHNEYQELIDQDRGFCEGLQAHPDKVYLELKNEFTGEVDFEFSPHRSILERIVIDLDQRMRRKFGDKHREALLKAKKSAEELLNAGKNPLYKKTIRYILLEYLPTLDLILFERHPELKDNKFHQINAGHLLEKILAKAPNMFLYFSFNWLGDDFFVDTRPALMNLIGINLTGLDDESQPPYADKYAMSLTEFAFHDLGHAEFTTMRDLQYLENDKKDIRRVVGEWEATHKKIKQVVEQIRAKDPELADSMYLLLFELLRERGFQFSLTVLKQELETEKWVYVLKKKFAQKFYDYYGINSALFDRLEEARNLLVQAVERYKEEAQIVWINAANATEINANIKYTPTLTFTSGRSKEIRVFKNQPTQVLVNTENGQTLLTEIREFVSAQVKPTYDHPFLPELVDKLEKILAREDTHFVVVDSTKQIWVEFKDGRRKKLEEIRVYNYLHKSRRIEEIEIFEIRQILGSEERNENQMFTLRQPTQTMIGTLTLEQNLVTGNYTAHVIESDTQKKYQFPLVELRVDPL